MAGLEKPDGLAIFQGALVLAQEGNDYPLLRLHQGTMAKLFQGNSILEVKRNADGSR